MQRTKPQAKFKKNLERLVGEESDLASVARLIFYQNDDLYKLEVLASVLNDVGPDSPLRHLADLIQRLVTIPFGNPAEWVEGQAPIIGSTRCTPASGSPLYGVNKFLLDIPCVLRIEGRKLANGEIVANAGHVPLPAPLFMKVQMKDAGISDKAIEGLADSLRATDRILWLLWEVFYRDIDLTRLKNCSVCQMWFVDHSKNKTKVRCSAACTSQRWSWAERKKAGHSQLNKKAKGGKYAKAKKA